MIKENRKCGEIPRFLFALLAMITLEFIDKDKR